MDQLARVRILVAALLAVATPAAAAPKPRPAKKAPRAVKAPRTRPPDAARPVKGQTVKGRVVALVRGMDVPLVFVGGIRRFDIFLERRAPSGKREQLTARTDERCAFTVAGAAPGEYLLRVRLPRVPEEMDEGELYRGTVRVPSGDPGAGLVVKIPFLAMKPVGADGQPVSWTELRLRTIRLGIDVHPQWGEGTFRKAPGVNPSGHLEERGYILVTITEQDGAVSVGYTWSARERNMLIFPILEEDGPVRYYMTLTVPETGCGTGRFGARRGQSPAELEFRLLPFAEVSGKLALRGVEGRLDAASVSLSIHDPADREVVLFRTSAPVQPDGSFSFRQVPPGLAWFSATVPGGPQAGANHPYRAGESFTLKAGEPHQIELPVTATSAQEADEKLRKFTEERSPK